MRLERDQLVSGRYRLIVRIGSGGMAEVWSATDELLRRPVAVKFLHERFSRDERFLERFQREASAAAGLQHPNIVSVYDRGEWEGFPYIVMEHVEGATLKDLIGRGLGVAEAVEITRQVLAGAGFAHSRGIIHRDLKPQNVLIDAEGRARVADFGIARAGASDVTEAGAVLGTAQYLSPEQAQGQDVTAATDIYSIGVLLYEALTGQVPFDAPTAVAVVMKHVTEAPIPPSHLNPRVGPALDRVVLRALAKDPRDRFASAREFSTALDAAWSGRDDEPTAATRVYAPAPVRPYDPDSAAAAEREAAGVGNGRPKWLRGWRLALLILLVLLIAAAIVFAVTRGGGDEVRVPDVVGEQAEDATGTLEGEGFAVDPRERPSCESPGTVVSQNPNGGDSADEGSTVVIRISAGQQAEIPDVSGRDAAEAEEMLEGLDMDLEVETRRRYNSDVEAGQAIGTQPGAGTEVECNTTVTLLVSRGEDAVEVPSVVGSDVAAAEAQLEAAGLVPNVVMRNSDEPEGRVLEQSPAAGESVERGAQVTLFVSDGAGTVVVPNVIGQPEQTALDTLEARGATNVRVTRQDTDDASRDGRVIDQAPGADTRIRAGDRVTLFVGRFVPPSPEDIGATAFLRPVLGWIRF